MKTISWQNGKKVKIRRCFLFSTRKQMIQLTWLFRMLSLVTMTYIPGNMIGQYKVLNRPSCNNTMAKFFQVSRKNSSPIALFGPVALFDHDV